MTLHAKVFPSFWFAQVVTLDSRFGTGGPVIIVAPKAVSELFLFPLSNVSPCTSPVSDTVIQFKGLTIVQVSQNQAAVVSDPQNRVFVVKVCSVQYS
jgi:hypothetical protein